MNPRWMVALTCALSWLLVPVAFAGELKVLTALAMQPVMNELAPRYESASGDKLALTFGTVGALVKRVQDGEQGDLVIAPRQGVDTLAKDSRLVDSSITNVAMSGLGVAVKSGAAKPDISSPEAFKRTVLLAKSITYINPAEGGASGPHIAKLMERLGIAQEMSAKTVFAKGTGAAAAAAPVLSGEAELVIHQLQDLASIQGISIVGPLPQELQNWVTYTAALFRGGNEDAGAALIRFLRTPEAVAVIKAKGMDAP